MTNRSQLRRSIVPALLALSLGCSGGAQPPRRYACLRPAQPPRIDGLLDDASWLAADWTADFVDIQGAGLPTPRLRTRVKMLWDDDHFYVAAELEEPHVWATLIERDSVIFQDNDFELFIDPDGDALDYYELEINALGTEWDLFLAVPYRDGGEADDTWDIAGLRSAVAIDGTLNVPDDVDAGWSLEIAVPWSALADDAGTATPPNPGDVWRINFSRVEWRTEIVDGRTVKRADPATGEPLPEDNWVWSPQGRIDMHQPETWGFVEFSAGAAGDR